MKYNQSILFIVNVDWFLASHRLPIALRARALVMITHSL